MSHPVERGRHVRVERHRVPAAFSPGLIARGPTSAVYLGLVAESAAVRRADIFLAKVRFSIVA